MGYETDADQNEIFWTAFRHHKAVLESNYD
jgi:hypothetical protein